MSNNPQKKCEHKNIGIVGNYKYCGDCNISVTPTESTTVRHGDNCTCSKGTCPAFPTQPDNCGSKQFPEATLGKGTGHALKPDIESWEENFAEFWSKLAGNTRLSLVQSSKVKEFIRKEKEESYQKGRTDESVKCWEHGEKYAEIGRNSAYSEIMEMVEGMKENNQFTPCNRCRGGHQPFCTCTIYKTALFDLLSKLKEKLSK